MSNKIIKNFFIKLKSAATIFVLLSLLVHLSGSIPFGRSNKSESYLNALKRKAKGAQIKTYINENVNPCDNFYNFACGKWNTWNPTENSKRSTTGFFDEMAIGLDRKMYNILTEDHPKDTPTDKKVKNFFQSCLALGKKKQSQVSNLMRIINEFGEMPAIEGSGWQAQKFDWVETIAKISHKYGIMAILGYEITADFNDNTKNVLYIGHPDFPLESRSMYVEEHTAIYRDSYTSYIASDLQTYLGIQKVQAEEVANEIVEFEVEMALGMEDDKAGLPIDELTLPITLQDMGSKYPNLDIFKLLNISIGMLPATNSLIYEVYPAYQENLEQLVMKTDKRILANYIFYQLINNFIYRRPGKSEDPKTKCVTITKKYFAKNLDNMVYRRYSNTNQTQADVAQMWTVVKNTFQQMLESEELSWIDKNTRKLAVDKLKAMKLELNAYIEDNFEQEFGELAISNDDYIENLKNIMMLSAKQMRQKLNEPPKPLEAGELLSYTPANIIVENKIKVPVALLQPYYLWDITYPNAVKYATLGSLISHELIHGFDDTGRDFDSVGNNKQWWDQESTDKFNNRTKCLINQYKEYVYNGKQLPEMASQSENIADNGGIRLAYRAYSSLLKNMTTVDRQSEKFHNFHYESKKLFFISYAQLWCSDSHPALQDLQTSIDTHVPSMYRVIGPLSNLAEFSEVFHCSKDSKMNRKNKCAIY